MENQQTLLNPIEYTGIDMWGGNLVKLRISPANPNTGIVFQTSRGNVGARLENARASRASILLKEGDAQVIHVEHLLATLWAYRIDNALVNAERVSTKTVASRTYQTLAQLGWATNVEVIPTCKDRELTLCEKIEEAGIRVQDSPRILLRPKEHFWLDARLKVFPTDSPGLKIRAITNYPQVGEQKRDFKDANPEDYRDWLASSRPYAKFMPIWAPRWLASGIASVLYPHFGLGHGFSENTVFLPPKTGKQWLAREMVPMEIAAHTAVDRIGALALLPGRLDHAYVQAKYSGHKHDIRTLKALVSSGKLESSQQ